MEINNLWVIIPVYNEEASIASVLDEWLEALNKVGLNYTFCVINDGSLDGTLSIIRDYESKYSQIKVIDKLNTGHGQTCIFGYKLALEHGADWVFQIDSDGQCSPIFFPDFVKASHKNSVVMANRTKREDGINRWFISRFVSAFTFFATGFWIKDLNVPYRLMHAKVLEKIVNLVPEEFHLANIYLTVLIRKESPIYWINIYFLKRRGGIPSKSSFSFIKHGFKLYAQLRQAVKKNSLN